ncbi:MAG: cytochrome C [Gammaproteobacteria bacterium]|nr:cytochrome C [Gammaproteobacteria bacterium]
MKSDNSTKKKMLLFAVIVFLLGIGFSGLFGFALDSTNKTEFCTRCHSMKQNLIELKESVHWQSGSGVHAGCADCHVPKQFLPKMWAKIMAAKDVYHEILGTIDTPEKYEARRWQMANAVWKKMKDSDSRECRNCHSFDHMDLSEQARSARKKHDSATDKGNTCIDCHKGIAHEEPDEPELPEEPTEATGENQ